MPSRGNEASAFTNQAVENKKNVIFLAKCSGKKGSQKSKEREEEQEKEKQEVEEIQKR